MRPAPLGRLSYLAEATNEIEAGARVCIYVRQLGYGAKLREGEASMIVAEVSVPDHHLHDE
jgi:hypothetical protein